jgi:hypothetical protein
MALSEITLASIADFRYDGFRNTYSPKLIGYGGNDPETRLVPNTFPYQIKLFEGIQENVPSTTRVKLVSLGIELVEVEKTQTPANMQYRVNYDELGYSVLEFNSAQKNVQVEISYYGLGHLIQKATLLALQRSNWYEIEVDYSISPYVIPDNIIDTATRIMIFADTSDGNVLVYLPDVALNRVEVAWKQTQKGGRLIIQTKAGDKIRGINDYDSVYADDIGNSGHIYSDTNYWFINGMIKHTIKFFDYQRYNDAWPLRNLGSLRIQYDNKVGSFILGETIEESVSGVQAILMFIDGTHLYVKNAVNNFVNNRTITGLTSGATCDVNEGSGATTNQDSPIFHNTDKNLNQIRLIMYVSSDQTWNNTFELTTGNVGTGSANQGITFHQYTTNSIIAQTATSGCLFVSEGSGSVVTITAGGMVYYDIYCKIEY